MIGRTIGSYDILSLLGQGGMGAVYRARDRVLGRDVAIKALLAELGDDARQRQRFLSEARAAAALDHVASGDYAGEHWLATFAVYLLSTP